MTIKMDNNINYGDPLMKKRRVKLINNIGLKLFNQLSERQKMLMVQTAGIVEFKRKIDINSVYQSIKAY